MFDRFNPQDPKTNASCFLKSKSKFTRQSIKAPKSPITVKKLSYQLNNLQSALFSILRDGKTEKLDEKDVQDKFKFNVNKMKSEESSSSDLESPNDTELFPKIKRKTESFTQKKEQLSINMGKSTNRKLLGGKRRSCFSNEVKILNSENSIEESQTEEINPVKIFIHPNQKESHQKNT